MENILIINTEAGLQLFTRCISGYNKFRMTRKLIKALLGYFAYEWRGRKKLFADEALIVTFHRVCEYSSASDINCTSDEFREFCEFLKKHFDVVKLDEIVGRLKNNLSVSGLAAITFDDGYLDNATVAAPILVEMDLPATFFVTTSFIDTSVQASWDRGVGVESKWMTWEDVEFLIDHRFDIGCHTDSHIDLGEVDLSHANTDILRSREILEEKLGYRPKFFAYPFGGKNNIRDDTRELVRKAGFQACFSCHGGLVRNGDELFHLQREPITAWHQYPYQFGYELLKK